MCDACLPKPLGLTRRRFLAGAAIGVGTATTASRGALAQASPPPLESVFVGHNLSIYPREAWATAPPKAAMNAEDVKFLLVHHTAGRQPSAAEAPEELRAIYRYHTGPDKGWPDVCYNFLVDPQGGVWEGRAGSLAGPVEASATGGSQGFAQLVCLLGDFTSVMPSDEAINSLDRTLAWLSQRYAIDTQPEATVSFTSRGSNLWPAGVSVTTSTISGHRDMSATACPGDTLYPYVVTTLRERVHAATLAAIPTTTPPPSTIGEASTGGEPATVPPPAAPTTLTRPPTTVAPANSVPTVPVATATEPASTVPPALSPVGAPSDDSSTAASTLAVGLGAVGILSLGGLAFVVNRRRAEDQRDDPS